MTGSGAGHPPADSHAVPWAGRQLGTQPFAADAGAADPRLSTALTGHAAGELTEDVVVAAIASARLLVPLVAALGRDHPVPDHVRADAGAEISVPILGSATSRALPVFSSVPALLDWDRLARPVPVPAVRAAQAAVEQDCAALVLDPAGPVRFVVRRPALWALAQGRAWVPAHRDEHVAAAVAALADGLAPVVAARCEPGDRADVRVVLAVVPGLSERELARLVEAVQDRLAGDELLTERAETVQLRVVGVGDVPATPGG